MSEDNSQEKTEQPTPKRLRDAKEKGQAARSRDFNTSIILLTSAVSLFLFGSYVGQYMLTIMRSAFVFNDKTIADTDMVYRVIHKIVSISAFMLTPFLILLVLASLCGPIILGGWTLSSKNIMPKLERLNPIKGLKKIFSLKGLMELVKALIKFSVILSVGIYVLWMFTSSLYALSSLSYQMAIYEGLYILSWSFLLISSSVILIAMIDVPYQLWEHTRQLKMTKQEVKDEFKETEGKPEVKSQIRRMQQEISRRRMMEAVPTADVIITNPTHYSIAIKYEDEGELAPRVIAKGKDFIALQINKVAIAKDVPVLQLPPLARAIYFSTKLNQEIPQGLYVAVAQVLAYIYRIRRQNKTYEQRPEMLKNLHIPKQYEVPGEG